MNRRGRGRANRAAADLGPCLYPQLAATVVDRAGPDSAKQKSLIFGPSGTFKSTSAVALTCAIAHGHTIADIAPDLTVPGVIVAAEDGRASPPMS